ncbi:hypothetical protein ACSBR1_015814 [Camellia fascicularis]
MVKWDEVSKSKKAGGLGIRKIRVMNIALLLKWWWRFVVEKDCLWRIVICDIHKIDTRCWLPVQSRNASKAWSDISLLCVRWSEAFVLFLNNIKYSLGRGNRLLFWSDEWVREGIVLQNIFPRLYQISSNKEGRVTTFVVPTSDRYEWKVEFRRPLMAWEEEQVAMLNNLLMGATEINQRANDTIGCRAANCGVYSVASMYNCIEAKTSLGMEVPKLIWRNGAPLSVKFFGWLVWRGRVKTSDRLARLGIIDNHNDGQCRFCGIENKTSEHVIIWCVKVWRIWTVVLHWWGLSWVVPGSVTILLEWWKRWKFRRKRKIVWEIIPFAALLSIWRLRNQCIFESRIGRSCWIQSSFTFCFGPH